MPTHGDNSTTEPRRLVIGLLGARGPGNTYLRELVGGATTFHWANHPAVVRRIEQFRHYYEHGAVHLLGYSLGGRSAVLLANRRICRIDHLVLFDAYAPSALFAHGAGRLRLTTPDLQTCINFYQRAPITWRYGIPYGTNPFRGSRITAADQTTVTEIELNRTHHVGIVRDAALRHPDLLAPRTD